MSASDLLRGNGKFLVAWLLISPAVFLYFLGPDIVPDYLRIGAFTAAGLVTWMTVEIGWLYSFDFWPRLTDEQRGRHYRPWLVWAMGGSYVALLVPACSLVYGNFNEPIQIVALPFLVVSLVGATVWMSALLRQFRTIALRG